MKEATRVITYQVTEGNKDADELTATLTEEQLRERASEMEVLLEADSVTVQKQQIFLTGEEE